MVSYTVLLIVTICLGVFGDKPHSKVNCTVIFEPIIVLLLAALEWKPALENKIISKFTDYVTHETKLILRSWLPTTNCPLPFLNFGRANQGNLFHHTALSGLIIQLRYFLEIISKLFIRHLFLGIFRSSTVIYLILSSWPHCPKPTPCIKFTSANNIESSCKWIQKNFPSKRHNLANPTSRFRKVRFWKDTSNNYSYKIHI